MNIEIDKLRLVANAIFDHIERRGIKSVDIDGPLYWHIGAMDRYSMASEPQSFDVGSLLDDYYDIKRVASGEQPVPAWHLEPLASVCDALGTILAKSLAPQGG